MTLPPSRQHIPRGELPRHRHADAYVALVLSGTYEEAGDHGRRDVRAGDVVAHQPWEAHLNRIPARGARILNLPVSIGLAPFGRVDDPDAIVRLHERDARDAALALLEQFRPAPAAASVDWPDALALGLEAHDDVGLGDRARELGISPEHLSRRFASVFGVSPRRFRWEARTRAAWRAITSTRAPLLAIAMDLGFADQAHLTRSVRALTGRTPGAWRRSTAFKTGS